MMYTFIALLAFVAIVSAKPRPTFDYQQAPCESPQAWEGDESLEIDAQNVSMYMKTSYDEVNERVRVLMHYDPEEHEVIILYNQKRLYNIVHKTGKCTVSSYETPFSPAQIPKSATFAFEGYVGVKSQGLLFKAYYGTFSKDAVNGNYVLSVVEPECVIVYSKVSYKGIVIRESISNVVLGIKDPSVFIPPKNCEEGPLPDFFKAHPRY